MFQEYFVDDIDIRVNLDSLSVNAISAQAMQLHKDRDPAWRLVFLETDFDDCKGRWTARKVGLRNAAERVREILQTRLVEKEGVWHQKNS